MTRWTVIGAALAVALAAPAAAPAAADAPAAAMPANYGALTGLFADWRRFVAPAVHGGGADYGSAAMAAQAAALPAWRARLAAIDRSGWPVAADTDWRLVEAEINALDFDHRVLKPWARDPSFYANIFADWSDVPAHEGPSAEPNIDLYAYRWPLDAAGDRRLTAALAAVPGNLAAAKANLHGADAHDLWAYGDRAFREQSDTLARLAAGTLTLKTLDGVVPADMRGASPALRRAIGAARAASDDFAAWVAAEAPKRQGPTGVGKANYDWYLEHVLLVPYDWDAQVTLLQRELDRALASLRLEEVRNRDLPPLVALTDADAYAKLVAAKEARFSDFLAATGLDDDGPWSRAAIGNQRIAYAAEGNRDFFAHVVALDPLPLISHFTHWIDLARMREAPHASPVRRVPPLFNIYSNRSEGFATAYEELLMQAGIYDDVPHGRELVWIMLANRAARGLASLHVQANEIGLDAAGRFHAGWTPRGWSDAQSRLVGFEQLLYARQPGYGPSYIVGKLQLDHLIAAQSHADEAAGRAFSLPGTMRRVMAAGVIPVALIEAELVPATSPAAADTPAPR